MSARAAALRFGALIVLIGVAFAFVASSGSLSADGLRDRVDGFGVAGPLVFIAAAVVLTPALFPGPLLAGAAGLLFGTALGTVVSIAAAVVGASSAFALARWLAHDAVERLAPPRVQALRAWVGERGFLSVLYARLMPGVPYSLVNYAAGLSPIRYPAFAGATTIGVAPRAFAYAALGGSFGDLGNPETIVAIVVLVLTAVAGLYFARRSTGAAAVRAAATGPPCPDPAPAGPGTAMSSPGAPTATRP